MPSGRLLKVGNSRLLSPALFGPGAIISAALSYSVSASAQVSPIIDTSQAMGIAAQGVAREQVARGQRGRSHARAGTNRTAQTCANGARMRAQGSRDPRLTQLARLCRQAGY